MDYKKLYWKMMDYYALTRQRPKYWKDSSLGNTFSVHHMWPRKVKPELTDVASNLVYLTHREHATAHVIFGKAYAEEYPTQGHSAHAIVNMTDVSVSPVVQRMVTRQHADTARRVLTEDPERMFMLQLGREIALERNPPSAEEQARRNRLSWETRRKKYGPTGTQLVRKSRRKEVIKPRKPRMKTGPMSEEKKKAMGEKGWATRREKYGATGGKPSATDFSQDQIDKLKELLSKGIGTLIGRNNICPNALKVIRKELGITNNRTVQKKLRKLILEIEADGK